MGWIAVPRACPGTGVGIVQLVRDSAHPGAAKVTIAVADDYRSQGLGRLLSETILLSALEGGVATLVGYVRPENVVARRLMRRLGARPPRPADGMLRMEVPVGIGPRTFRTSDALARRPRR